MIVRIFPSIAKGIMEAPPSKSMAHRLIICAGLAEGESIIENVDSSEDILATLDCLAAIGAGIRWEKPGVLHIEGVDLRKTFMGRADHRRVSLPCRECGSSLRFFIPLCLVNGEKKTLTGSDTLFSRPLSIYENICKDQGLFYEKKKNSLTLEGRLKGGDYQVPGNISSQFISGLLFTLPLLEKDSRIRLIPPVESRPYIDMTIQALTRFGIRVSWENDLTLLVPGNQTYLPRRVRVEGDYSNAAFFEALNLAGGDVTLEGLTKDSLQGDKIYKEYFKQINAGFAELDIADCPDLGPVLMAAAAMKYGARFTGTRRLRIKESDRGLAMKQELAKLGIDITVEENEILIPADPITKGNISGSKKVDETFVGKRNNNSGEIVLDGHNDHRIVMALSVLLTKTGGSIAGAEAVKKSLPDFFERLGRLGIGVAYDALD